MRDYKVVAMSDTEFERLPFGDMSDVLGIADPRTNTAYYRESGIPAMDAFTISHELQHLDEKHEGEIANHYNSETGVYYKKGKSFLRIALPILASFALPGIGTAIGGAIGGAGAGTGVATALGHGVTLGQTIQGANAARTGAQLGGLAGSFAGSKTGGSGGGEQQYYDVAEEDYDPNFIPEYNTGAQASRKPSTFGADMGAGNVGNTGEDAFSVTGGGGGGGAIDRIRGFFSGGGNPSARLGL